MQLSDNRLPMSQWFETFNVSREYINKKMFPLITKGNFHEAAKTSNWEEIVENYKQNIAKENKQNKKLFKLF